MKSHKVTVEAPDDMDEATAQQCLLLGIRAYITANNAGLCVIHGIERNKEVALRLLAFRDEYAFAVMKFCEGIGMLEEKDTERNLAIIRDKGKEIIEELEK